MFIHPDKKASFLKRGSLSTLTITVEFPRPSTVLLGTLLALWSSCVILNEWYCYSKCCHWMQMQDLQFGRSIGPLKTLLAFPEKDDDNLPEGKVQAEPYRSRFPFPFPRARAAGRVPEAPARRAPQTRGEVRSSSLTPSAFACQLVLTGLSRPRSSSPLPHRASSTSHLALALSAVFVPFTQSQRLLQQHQLRSRRRRRHLPAWAPGRGGTQTARTSCIGGEGSPHKRLRLLAERSGGRGMRACVQKAGPREGKGRGVRQMERRWQTSAVRGLKSSWGHTGRTRLWLLQ